MLFAPAGFRPPKHRQEPQGAPRIYELLEGQCKYPVAFVEGKHRFCAGKQAWGSPYCAEHNALCTGSRTLAPRLQERVL